MLDTYILNKPINTLKSHLKIASCLFGIVTSSESWAIHGADYISILSNATGNVIVNLELDDGENQEFDLSGLNNLRDLQKYLGSPLSKKLRNLKSLNPDNIVETTDAIKLQITELWKAFKGKKGSYKQILDYLNSGHLEFDAVNAYLENTFKQHGLVDKEELVSILLETAVKQKHVQAIYNLGRASNFEKNSNSPFNRSMLLLAVEAGNQKVVEALLKIGLNPFLVGADQKSAIQYALNNNVAYFFDTILTNIDHFELEEEEKQTLISICNTFSSHINADSEITQLSKMFSELGNSDLSDFVANTTFANELLDNHERFWKMIRDKKLQVDEEKFKSILIHAAVLRDSKKLIKSIHSTYNIDLNTTYFLKQTPLHNALANHKNSAMEALIEIGVDIWKKNSSNVSAIAEAGVRENKRFFAVLKKHQEKYMYQGDVKNSLLHFAVLNKNRFVAEKLIKYEVVDKNALNNHGNSVLFDATLKDSWDCVDFLLSIGADIYKTTKSERRESAIGFAAFKNKDRFFEILRNYQHLYHYSGHNSIMHHAAYLGYAKQMEKLVAFKVGDINAINDHGNSVLHDAMFVRDHHSEDAKKRKNQIIRLLIENMADIFRNGEDKGCKPLDKAISENNGTFIEALRDNEYKYRFDGGTNNTLNHFVTIHHQTGYLRFFADHGIGDINALNNHGNSVLHDALYFHNKEATDFLLSRQVDLFKTNNNGYHGLRKAVAENKDFFFHSLKKYQHHYKFNGGTHNSILHMAVLTKNLDLTRKLLEYNVVDINAVNAFGNSVISDAVLTDDKDIYRELFKRGADIWHRGNGNGEWAIWRATERNHWHFFQVLKEFEHKYRYDGCNNTILHRAALWDQGNIAAKLIETGTIDKNVKNNYGNTPLHDALIFDKYWGVHALVKKHANIWTKNNEGKKPVTYAYDKKRKYFFHILKEYNRHEYDKLANMDKITVAAGVGFGIIGAGVVQGIKWWQVNK